MIEQYLLIKQLKNVVVVNNGLLVVGGENIQILFTSVGATCARYRGGRRKHPAE